AGAKWTGQHGFGVPGYDPNMVVTKEMMRDPNFAIPLMKAIAQREAGRKSPLTDEQWKRAHEIYLAGGLRAWQEARKRQQQTPARAGARPPQALSSPAMQPLTPAAPGIGSEASPVSMDDATTRPLPAGSEASPVSMGEGPGAGVGAEAVAKARSFGEQVDEA